MPEKSGVEILKERMGKRVVHWEEWSPTRSYVELKAADIPEGARFLFEELGARFITASGVDNGDEMEILYHFAFDGEGKVVSLRVRLDRDRPEIESIAHIIAGTEWIEREMWELLGIQFKDHPDLRRLLLADDWPEGDYPLRRS